MNECKHRHEVGASDNLCPIALEGKGLSLSGIETVVSVCH